MPLKISIIIPVYRAANTIERAVESIYRQGLDDGTFEVLLVNDGSPDDSLDVCNALADRHKSVRVINKPNGGVASARNKGLDEAQGEWIAFLDDDDYLLDNGFAIALKPYLDRNDLDVIRYYSSYDNSPIKEICDEIASEGNVWDLLKADKTFLPSFVWLQAYRRERIKKYGIRFHNVAMFDDFLFASSVFLTNPKLLTTKANIVRYVVRQGSGTLNRKIDYSRKVAEGSLNTYQLFCEFGHKTGADRNEAVWSRCLATINNGKRIGITRMLSSRYNKKEFAAMSTRCKSTGYYPILPPTYNYKKRIEVCVLNSIMSRWTAYRFYSFLFIHIIDPYVMPRIRKGLK